MDTAEVVHVNLYDSGNGAARAAHRLHQGLRGEGVSSKMYVRWKKTSGDHVIDFDPPTDICSRIYRRLRREWIQYAFSKYAETRPEKPGPFHGDRSEFKGQVLGQCPSADVFNLHSIYDFLDVGSFFRDVSVPVVWTLHDMNPFTGGCQYSGGCARFRQSCGQCPQLGSNTRTDLSRNIWSRKRRAYQHAIENDRLRVVCPSQWMASEARQSSLFSDVPVKVIPNSVDTNVFRPRDTEGIPAAFEIPSSHRTLLFLSSSIEQTRKGFNLFREAVKSLSTTELSVISVGGGDSKLSSSVSHIHLGSISNDRLLSLIYSTADVFVIPSRQDNLPNTVLESMACGTPVVGFDVGGIPDMVRPGETGWLAEAEDSRALGEAIDAALADDVKRERMEKRCREVIEAEYALEVQANNYRKLYNEMIQSESVERSNNRSY
ncbi:glycosyltransferase family 4 protein [Salinibacter ruber]|uniref:glycosyltransferase family 4 protein n=1 Tax=Salinibacter ruber TaxID=146919 RepID=UPI00216777A0|nr:glycosyltransferase family 4 protein [Salinibacter ruber]